MIFSKSCIYGLRAMIYLASRTDERYESIKQLSEKLDISFHFLTKILQELTAADLLESMKGPKGGVRLAKSADAIVLKEVVIAIDGPAIFTECVLGLPGCGHEKPCPMHDMWMDSRDEIDEIFTNTTLYDLSKEGKEKDLRITPDGEFIWS